MGLGTGIVAPIQSVAVLNLFFFYSVPGKIAEDEGGSGQWPKYSLRIITGPSCPLLLPLSLLDDNNTPWAVLGFRGVLSALHLGTP